MKSASEYRLYAEECRALAKQMQEDQRERLLEMARTWDRLAFERTDLQRQGSELAPQAEPLDGSVGRAAS